MKRDEYFKPREVDWEYDRGKESKTLSDTYPYVIGKKRNPALLGKNLDNAILLERIWEIGARQPFRVGPDYVATWFNGPLGYSLHKVKSISPYLDRCAIDHPDEPASYALFDLYTQNQSGNGGPFFVIYDLHEYHISDEDETLLRICI